MFLIKQQLTTSNKVHKQSSVTEVFSYNIVLGERLKILLCHQPFFYHLSGRQLSMMHAIITVSEANKAYAYANLFSRRKVHLVNYFGCWCFEKPQTYTLDIFSDGLWGWLSKLLSVTSKPKENTFKKYSFLRHNKSNGENGRFVPPDAARQSVPRILRIKLSWPPNLRLSLIPVPSAAQFVYP